VILVNFHIRLYSKQLLNQSHDIYLLSICYISTCLHYLVSQVYLARREPINK
jgi:hypothetical protein